MSSKERRAEKQREWEAELIHKRQEQNRKDALSMWERIEEADLSDDLKEILHRLARGERE